MESFCFFVFPSSWLLTSVDLTAQLQRSVKCIDSLQENFIVYLFKCINILIPRNYDEELPGRMQDLYFPKDFPKGDSDVSQIQESVLSNL